VINRSRPKKVLRILNRFNVGGPTYNATYLTKFLAPEFETLLIAGNKLDSESSSEYILNKYNINYHLVKSMNRSLNLFKDIKSLFEILSIIKKFKPDIVHTHASKSGAIGRVAALISGTPIIVHTFHGHVFHSYFGKLKTGFYILLERFLAKRSSAIIAISKLQKDELVNTFNICSEDKMHVINLGFDLDRFEDKDGLKRRIFREEFSLSDEHIAIGIIGRLTSIKDHKFFIDVANIVNASSKKNLTFFIIGDGEERSHLEEYILSLDLKYSSPEKDSGPEPLFRFTSWRQDMENIYSGLDIIALTSKNEGTPVTLIEGQAASRPVISTDVGGVADIVIHESTGYISDIYDINTYTKNLLILIEDNDVRALMGSNGSSHIKSKFTYERLVDDVRNLYNSF